MNRRDTIVTAGAAAIAGAAALTASMIPGPDRPRPTTPEQRRIRRLEMVNGVRPDGSPANIINAAEELEYALDWEERHGRVWPGCIPESERTPADREVLDKTTTTMLTAYWKRKHPGA